MRNGSVLQETSFFCTNESMPQSSAQQWYLPQFQPQPMPFTHMLLHYSAANNPFPSYYSRSSGHHTIKKTFANFRSILFHSIILTQWEVALDFSFCSSVSQISPKTGLSVFFFARKSMDLEFVCSYGPLLFAIPLIILSQLVAELTFSHSIYQSILDNPERNGKIKELHPFYYILGGLA